MSKRPQYGPCTKPKRVYLGLYPEALATDASPRYWLLDCGECANCRLALKQIKADIKRLRSRPKKN